METPFLQIIGGELADLGAAAELRRTSLRYRTLTDYLAGLVRRDIASQPDHADPLDWAALPAPMRAEMDAALLDRQRLPYFEGRAAKQRIAAKRSAFHLHAFPLPRAPLSRAFPWNFEDVPDSPTKEAARRLTLPQFCEAFGLSYDLRHSPTTESPWFLPWPLLRQVDRHEFAVPCLVSGQPVPAPVAPLAVASWFFGIPAVKIAERIAACMGGMEPEDVARLAVSEGAFVALEDFAGLLTRSAWGTGALIGRPNLGGITTALANPSPR